MNKEELNWGPKEAALELKLRLQALTYFKKENHQHIVDWDSYYEGFLQGIIHTKEQDLNRKKEE